jgi:hypothetical protein
MIFTSEIAEIATILMELINDMANAVRGVLRALPRSRASLSREHEESVTAR